MHTFLAMLAWAVYRIFVSLLGVLAILITILFIFSDNPNGSGFSIVALSKFEVAFFLFYIFSARRFYKYCSASGWRFWRATSQFLAIHAALLVVSWLAMAAVFGLLKYAGIPQYELPGYVEELFLLVALIAIALFVPRELVYKRLKDGWQELKEESSSGEASCSEGDQLSSPAQKPILQKNDTVENQGGVNVEQSN